MAPPDLHQLIQLYIFEWQPANSSIQISSVGDNNIGIFIYLCCQWHPRKNQGAQGIMQLAFKLKIDPKRPNINYKSLTDPNHILPGHSNSFEHGPPVSAKLKQIQQVYQNHRSDQTSVKQTSVGLGS